MDEAVTPAEVRAAVKQLPARTVLGLTLWGEARGEPVEGQVAVAWVIRNRAARRHQTVQHVCLDRWQFSCWWGQDVNAQALRARALRVITGDVVPEPRWLALLQLAYQVLHGVVPDPTQGADHYLTTALYQDEDAPTWSKVLPVTVTIGHHTFLKDDGSRRA